MFLYSEYIFVLVVGLIFVGVFLSGKRGGRRAALRMLFKDSEALHAVDPDTPVIDCVRKMCTEKIGALIVIDGEKLAGIFTERDALNKVLAAGLDPAATKIAEVMTRDPYCVAPTMTVGDAMDVVTQRRFRHLPVVANGKVLALVSSGDLIHWLVKDKIDEVQELVGAAARSS